MRAILIAGTSGAGKDTAARACHTALRRLGYAAQHYKLSRPLKQSARILYGLTSAQLEGAAKDAIDPNWGVTPREVFIELAASLEAKDPAALARMADAEYHQMQPGAVMVVSDLRRTAQAAYLQKRGAKVVWLGRSQHPGNFQNTVEVEAYRLSGIADSILSEFVEETDLEEWFMELLPGWEFPMIDSRRSLPPPEDVVYSVSIKGRTYPISVRPGPGELERVANRIRLMLSDPPKYLE